MCIGGQAKPPDPEHGRLEQASAAFRRFSNLEMAWTFFPGDRGCAGRRVRGRTELGLAVKLDGTGVECLHPRAPLTTLNLIDPDRAAPDAKQQPPCHDSSETSHQQISAPLNRPGCSGGGYLALQGVTLRLANQTPSAVCSANLGLSRDYCSSDPWIHPPNFEMHSSPSSGGYPLCPPTGLPIHPLGLLLSSPSLDLLGICIHGFLLWCLQ